MELFLNILLLAVGFLALIKGADFFVDGSSALAKNFKVPGVIIGLTIVAMGTIHPITVNLASVTDLAVLVVVSIITMIFARTKNIGRAEGAVMVMIYAADVVFAVLR